MSAPSEKVQKQGQGLPDPELNPLTNPLLARNMGRWAEVYFTNPPDKREEAVQELLRELRSKEGENSEAASAGDPSAPTKTVEESQPQLSAGQSRLSADEQEEAPVCPACFRKNRADDRFCGLCGFQLKPDSKQETPAVTPVESTPAQPPAPPERTPADRTEDGWEWLREKNLASFQSSTQPLSSNVWKYASVVVILALCAIGGYAFWARSGARGKPAAAAVTSAPQPANPAPPQPQDQHPTSQEAQTSPPSSAPSAQQTQPPGQPEAAQSNTNQDQSSQTPPQQNATGDMPAEEGRQELLQAKRYLEGKGVPKSSTAAASLLWKSVAKQNPEAVLLLSDLYVRGDGVPQSCDQARLLLDAAAKRGSSEAGEKLAILQNAGCH